MKLSTLIVLFAVASSVIAQETAKPPDKAHNATPAPPPVIVSAQDWATLQKMSKEEFQQKLQELTDRASQSGCPVVLTSAQITPYLMLLRDSSTPADVSEAAGAGPKLDLNFRNASGKEIHSMQFDAEFLAKKSIYDLQPIKIDLHLTANGTSSLDKTLDHLRHLPLAQQPHPVALNRLTLEQVTFADGSVWVPAMNNYCGYSPNREWEIGAR